MISIILLSIIQGISEFLPISSSYHLLMFREVFGIGKDILTSNIELTFDIALHFGTFLSILVYFFKDFKEIVVKKESKLLWYIIIATIPASISGVFFDDYIENIVRTKYIFITIIFIVTGIIIYYVDRNKKREKSLNDMNIKDSIIIGLSQVLALIPGVSRSGITLTSSRLLNYERDESAKFSFFLAEPIVLGALLIKLLKTDISLILSNISIFIVGVLTSFIIGIISINYLLQYLKTNSFRLFMWYRIALGVLFLIYLLV